jgi:hypothetical protein
LEVEIRINRSKTGQHLTSIDVFFDQYNVGKKSKKTLIQVKCCPVLLRLILISTFLCTVKVPKNNLSLHCRRKTKELLKKELLNVTPALRKNDNWKKLVYSGLYVLLCFAEQEGKQQN